VTKPLDQSDQVESLTTLLTSEEDDDVYVGSFS